MSKLRWDPKNNRESADARVAFNLFLRRNFRAYTPRGRELSSFDEASGAAVFKKVKTLSALERILDGDDYGNDRDEPRG